MYMESGYFGYLAISFLTIWFI